MGSQKNRLKIEIKACTGEKRSAENKRRKRTIHWPRNERGKGFRSSDPGKKEYPRVASQRRKHKRSSAKGIAHKTGTERSLSFDRKNNKEGGHQFGEKKKRSEA